ncbi:tesmin TSO1-like CXC domain protein (macronuclear) [Tetrahymena thermophila SB210]|uniref:Tesmin TSO1-like CXC domain protein n=1 Tax=Tetrahymena thermophila (strain SB210) TaxID=312017 RepID=I7LU92_TETTS|nr:tesmin TSO1-like CXC domain protein [Tetrahymena thermophila SB210]EAR90838.2 tesmin TSO1-like CXC domain protein [Tetrahymena thermophila SB210]|eukprot:XP_001011083.2 tesmin TSO1-like CXC domain protein [Tetrahymena thermophila SB210]
MSEQIFNKQITIPQIQIKDYNQQNNDSQYQQELQNKDEKSLGSKLKDKLETQKMNQLQRQQEESDLTQKQMQYSLSQFISQQLTNLNAEKDNQKSNQLSDRKQISGSQSRDCIENSNQNKEKVQSQSYLNQSQSSESNSSSCPIQKLKNQIFNMNLSSSSEQLQDEISPKNDSSVNKASSSLQPISDQINRQENNLCFLKSNQHSNTNNANKFHFNKENYLDILVSEQQKGNNNDDQLNVQQTIEKYNSFAQSSFQQGFKRERSVEEKTFLQNINHASSSSQDLLSVIFCQNSQQLPFSLNIPQSITKYLPKQSTISTEKLDTFGGLEKTINEKFINSRKNSTSQNSSDNLTAHFNNEYSNQHTSACSSTSSNTQKGSNNNKGLIQCSSNFIKKPSPTQIHPNNTQPLSISNQQNVVKSPKAIWKNAEQKQNSQQLPPARATYDQFNLSGQKASSNQQNDSILSNLSNQALSQISNLINQSQLINNGSGSQQIGINLNQQSLFSNQSSNSSNNGNKKNRICNCKKTKCLKLYCDCFAVGELCGQDCKCVECCNNEATLNLRNQAIEGILQRNPFAFNVKPEEAKKSKKELNNSILQNSNSKVIGCNCRKSNCLKKYCLCYHSGMKCSEACKCTECKNLENGLNSSSHSLCSSSMQYQSNNNNNQVLMTNSQKQNLYHQNLQQSVKNQGQDNNNENFIPIQQIIENLALAAQQTQLQSNNFNRLLQSIPKQQDDNDDDEDDILEGHENEENEPIQVQQNVQKDTKQALNSYNNLFLNAISQFSLNLQDNNHNEGLGSSPTFSNLQQQSMRKKLFLNDSGQTTPVSPGGFPIQNQQSHLNMQNINNLFSLIKNISSTDQYQ